MKTTDTLNSLMFLTDEPDEHLYNNVAEAIVSFGGKAIPLLKKKINDVCDLYHKRRLEYLIYIIERHDIMKKLKLWREKREHDLMEPYFILARHRFPNADWAWFGFQLMMIVEQAEKEINTELTPLEQVKTLNHIIYDINKFHGDSKYLNNPDYYFINTLLETHIGNPLTLGMLYCIVAERLDIPIYGVDLPNHFILAYCNKTERFPQLEDVLFYINPYNNGNVLTRRDIRNYLSQLNLRPELKYFEPSKNEYIVRKLFKALIKTYSMSGKDPEANEMREMMNY